MLPGWGRSVAAAAAAAVTVAGTAVAAAEVAVAGQEPEDDEQDDGVLIQAEEASVAVTHSIAPFLRAQLLFMEPVFVINTGPAPAAWRRSGGGPDRGGFPALPRSNLSYAAHGKMVSE